MTIFFFLIQRLHIENKPSPFVQFKLNTPAPKCKGRMVYFHIPISKFNAM